MSVIKKMFVVTMDGGISLSEPKLASFIDMLFYEYDFLKNKLVESVKFKGYIDLYPVYDEEMKMELYNMKALEKQIQSMYGINIFEDEIPCLSEGKCKIFSCAKELYLFIIDNIRALTVNEKELKQAYNTLLTSKHKYKEINKEILIEIIKTKYE